MAEKNQELERIRCGVSSARYCSNEHLICSNELSFLIFTTHLKHLNLGKILTCNSQIVGL